MKLENFLIGTTFFQTLYICVTSPSAFVHVQHNQRGKFISSLSWNDDLIFGVTLQK